MSFKRFLSLCFVSAVEVFS